MFISKAAHREETLAAPGPRWLGARDVPFKPWEGLAIRDLGSGTGDGTIDDGLSGRGGNMANEEMEPSMQSLIEKMRRLLGSGGDEGMTSMVWLSPEGGMPIRQTQLAPPGLQFCEDVSPGRWVEESLSGFARLHALLPPGFPAYARVFHPAYLDDTEEQPVRWSTVASWTGKIVHPLMQFPRVAGLGEEEMYPDPPWGEHPRIGSIPEAECRVLANVLREFTSTPDRCFFGLWDGYGNIVTRLYPAGSRVKGRGRDYLLFKGPLEGVMAFLVDRPFPFWGDSPNIWWPEDRAWCVATDIDLYDTYVGGSLECVQAVLDHPDLEALPTSLDARLDLGGDTVNG